MVRHRATFRHSTASILAESGVSMGEIAQMLGHSNTRMVESVYAKFSPTYLRKAADAGVLMVGAVGIEPTTPSMSPKCSTAELSALMVQSNRNPIRNPLPYQWTALSCQGSALPLS